MRCSQCKSVFVVEQPEENDLVHIEISEEESPFFHEEVDSEDREQAELEAPESRTSSKHGLRGKSFCLQALQPFR